MRCPLFWPRTTWWAAKPYFLPQLENQLGRCVCFCLFVDLFVCGFIIFSVIFFTAFTYSRAADPIIATEDHVVVQLKSQSSNLCTMPSVIVSFRKVPFSIYHYCCCVLFCFVHRSHGMNLSISCPGSFLTVSKWMLYLDRQVLHGHEPFLL